MTNEILNPNELVELEGVKITRSQLELIKRTIFIGATDDELRLFFYECARRGTHPMDRLIFPIARKDKEGNRHVTFQTSIDYLRAAGEETGRYIGQKSVTYGPDVDQLTSDGNIKVPEWADVIVIRKDSETGESAEIPFRAFWKEYYPGEKLGFMWIRMPHLMLAKCAEAGALRKGFPRKLGGLYINEELERADAVPFTPIAMPREKKNGSEPVPNPNTILTGISNVTQKDGVGKDKKPFTLYTIHIGEKKYTTFNKTIAEDASRASKTGLQVNLEFKNTTYGPEIMSLNVRDAPEGDENAQ